MVSRTYTNPISSWAQTVTPGLNIASSGYIDALKEIENAYQNIYYELAGTPDAGSINDYYLVDLHVATAHVLTMDTGTISPTVRQNLLRQHIDHIRSVVGVGSMSWSTLGGNKTYSKSQIDEIQDAVGLSVSENDLSALPAGDREGAVTKELVGGTIGWADASDSRGSPFVVAGSKSVRRIVQFPESTRVSGVEHWLIFGAGSSGQWTGNSTYEIRLAALDASNATTTYNSASTLLAGTFPVPETNNRYAKKLTGYPTSGSGVVDLLVMLSSESTSDGLNLYPLRTATDPEARLWMPKAA